MRCPILASQSSISLRLKRQYCWRGQVICWASDWTACRRWCGRASGILDDRTSGVGALHFDAQRFKIDQETILIHGERLGSTWGEVLTRVLFTAARPPQRDRWVWHFVPR
jgi:hypothetical protein